MRRVGEESRIGSSGFAPLEWIRYLARIHGYTLLPSFHSIPFLHLFALRNFSREQKREKEYFGIPFPGKIGGKNSAGRNCGGWVDRWIGGTIISTSLPPVFRRGVSMRSGIIAVERVRAPGILRGSSKRGRSVVMVVVSAKREGRGGRRRRRGPRMDFAPRSFHL